MLCPPGARGTGLPLLELASLRLIPLNTANSSYGTPARAMRDVPGSKNLEEG